MNADAAPAAKSPGFLSRAVDCYQQQTGQPALVWLLVACANFAFQAVLFHEMFQNPSASGEFGIFNAILGLISLLTVPILALQQSFHLYPMRPDAASLGHRLHTLRASAVTVVETTTWAWAVICTLLALIFLTFTYLPRFPLQVMALINVLLLLGAIISRTLCESANRLRHWFTLLVAAAAARLFIGIALVPYEPWADAGLAAFLLSGFITLVPALRSQDVDWRARLHACREVLDRDFLLFAGATFSVLMGSYLFTNADRIICLFWPGITDQTGTIVGMDISKINFDQYQAAGLLGRGLLWGTQPLLWILFAQRTRLPKSNSSSLTFFWVYLGALILGAIMLGLLTQLRTLQAEGASFSALGAYGPTFAAVMIPLGLLQGVGYFSLASRRYPECFVLGGSSVVYTVVLFLFGRRPDLMLPYMFGASIVCLMAVLFVGIVRWGRRQP
jgi:hypothetical protein